MTFKNKDDIYDFPTIRKLAKRFGIQINVKQILEKGFKDKSVAVPIKDKLLSSLWTILNKENDFIHKNSVKKGYSKCYKYHVGKGNNGQLIKALMKQRFWWQSHNKEDMTELNFLWTEWRKNSEINKLPSQIPKPIVVVPQESESSDESEEKDNEGEEGRVLPSAKYLHTFLPEQNIPHESQKVCNRIEENHNLTNKKSLFVNMQNYYESLGQDPFEVLPKTFHIKKGDKDEDFQNFK